MNSVKWVVPGSTGLICSWRLISNRSEMLWPWRVHEHTSWCNHESASYRRDRGLILDRLQERDTQIHFLWIPWRSRLVLCSLAGVSAGGSSEGSRSPQWQSANRSLCGCAVVAAPLVLLCEGTAVTWYHKLWAVYSFHTLVLVSLADWFPAGVNKGEQV